jgi:CRISPR system Cascade subunit CasE
MFLSRLHLNARDAGARRDLADRYQMHSTLARVFAASPDAPPSRFLWRQEVSSGGGPGEVVLVQAQQPGRWSVLTELGTYLVGIEMDKPLDIARLLERSMEFRFRLQANPTVTRGGKRLGLVGESHQVEWLARQSSKHGFEVLSVVRSHDQRMTMRRRDATAITLHSVQFDGVLRLKDAGLLAHCVATGVGHGKALGMGLLSVAPATLRA